MGIMASLTLKSIPESLMEQLRSRAERERRSLNQQAILLLEQALEQERPRFMDRYQAFIQEFGPSPLNKEDLNGLRWQDKGRTSPFEVENEGGAEH